MLTSSESVKSGADRDEKPNFVSLFGNRSLSLYHNSKQNGHQQAKSGVDRRSTSLFGCAAIQSSAEDILQHLQGWGRSDESWHLQEIGEYRDMGVSNSLQWYMLQAFLLLGYWGRDFGYCHTWHSQENSEDTIKGNYQSRRNKKRVL